MKLPLSKTLSSVCLQAIEENLPNLRLDTAICAGFRIAAKDNIEPRKDCD
jgi:hypothetical protein